MGSVLQSLIEAQMAGERAERVLEKGQLTLGQLIDALAMFPPDAPIEIQGQGPPDRFSSWRGIYAELAITPGGQPSTIREFIDKADDADGQTFTGYKGGDFMMSRSTPVWVSPWGEANHDAVVGLEMTDGTVIIKTRDTEPYDY